MPSPSYRLTHNGRRFRSALQSPHPAEISSTGKGSASRSRGNGPGLDEVLRPLLQNCEHHPQWETLRICPTEPSGLLLCWLQRGQLAAPNLNLQRTPPGKAGAKKNEPLSPYGEPGRDNQVGDLLILSSQPVTPPYQASELWKSLWVVAEQGPLHSLSTDGSGKRRGSLRGRRGTNRWRQTQETSDLLQICPSPKRRKLILRLDPPTHSQAKETEPQTVRRIASTVAPDR